MNIFFLYIIKKNINIKITIHLVICTTYHQLFKKKKKKKKNLKKFYILLIFI